MASRRVTAILSEGFASYRDISNILSTCGFWHLVKGSFGDRGTLIRKPGSGDNSGDGGKGLRRGFEALQLFEGFNCEARWAMQVIGTSYDGDSFTVVSIVANIP